MMHIIKNFTLKLEMEKKDRLAESWPGSVQGRASMRILDPPILRAAYSLAPMLKDIRQQGDSKKEDDSPPPILRGFFLLHTD